MTNIIYTRRSSESGDDYSIETQAEACRVYARSLLGLNDRDIEIITENVTGTKHLRDRTPDAGARLWTLLQAGHVDNLIVYTADRLSRAKLSRTLAMIEDILETGTRLHSADAGEVTDADDIGGVIRWWQANEERKKIVDRLMRGKQGKARAQKPVNVGPAPYGFRKIGRGKLGELEIDEQQADVLRLLIGRYLGTTGPALATRGLQKLLRDRHIPSPGGKPVWTLKTVARVLRSPNLIGRFDFGPIEVSRPDLAIIDQATWLQLQARIKQNQERSPRNRKLFYPLAGRVFCLCGHRMTCSHSGAGGQYRYHRCGQSVSLAEQRSCPVYAVPAVKLEAAVWQWVLKHLEESELQAGLERRDAAEHDAAADRRRLAHLDVEERRLNARLDDLMRQFGTDAKPAVVAARDRQIDWAADRIAQITDDRRVLQNTLARAEAHARQRAGLVEMVRAIRGRIDNATPAQQQDTIDALDITLTLVEKTADAARFTLDSEIDITDTLDVPLK